MTIPFLACMAAVAAFYQLPPRVLPSIQLVEGGAVGSIHVNADGSRDFGVMQINDQWIGIVAEYARLPRDVVQRRLVWDGCFNVAAAGLIVRVYLHETHGDLMRSIGNYHSHTLARNMRYQGLVLQSAERLFHVQGR